MKQLNHLELLCFQDFIWHCSWESSEG